MSSKPVKFSNFTSDILVMPKKTVVKTTFKLSRTS